jgi:hypothetical protein
VLLAAASERQILESMGLRGVDGGVTSRRRHVVFPRTGNRRRRLAQERRGLHSPRGGGARRVREEWGLREGFLELGTKDIWTAGQFLKSLGAKQQNVQRRDGRNDDEGIDVLAE